MGFSEKDKKQWARLKADYPVIAWSMLSGAAVGAAGGIAAAVWFGWPVGLDEAGLVIATLIGGLFAIPGAVVGLLVGVLLQMVVSPVRSLVRWWLSTTATDNEARRISGHEPNPTRLRDPAPPLADAGSEEGP